MIVNFDYDILQKVRILPLGLVGLVDSLGVDSLGITYRVAYWADSERRSVWCYAEEITAEPAP